MLDSDLEAYLEDRRVCAIEVKGIVPVLAAAITCKDGIPKGIISSSHGRPLLFGSQTRHGSTLHRLPARTQKHPSTSALETWCSDG